ncbi:helix-turn-helix domain-containing protein [Streptomyces sp. NPDC002698]|uniref:helix-turn-helix domain-containing protein n=1 Tax=Streptomyces sp. NPDC002698 TaxID=3364660 RepID=UPI0036C456F0
MTSGYVQIPNVAARYAGLSLEAVGLLTYLLSLPDRAGATVDSVCAKVSNGRRTVSKAMNELVAAGYVKRAKLQDPSSGKWVTVTSVTDTPESPTDTFPTVGSPTGQPVGGSPIGSKTKSKKDITTPSIPVQRQEAAPLAPEGDEKQGEGEKNLVRKINREMAKEARRILMRLSGNRSLRLTDQEIERLAPKVVPWLREDYRSEEILQCLTAALPERIDSVPALISHRLTHFTPVRAAISQQAAAPVERAHCEVCEAIFPLGHSGGVCRNCQAEMNRAASFIAAA